MRRRLSTNKGSSKQKILRVILAILALFFVIVLVGVIKYSPFLFQLVFNHGVSLQQTDGRVNILLLGIGGGVHEGPDLTDTIIFASIDLEKSKITMVSLPRDLWMPELKGKINTAYTIGEDKKPGMGLVLAKAAVSKLLGQPIHYGFRIDFDGFVKAVDLVGGLDINVDRTFDDYEYPITGQEDNTCGYSKEEVEKLATASSELEAFPCRYMHLHFNKGLQHMDGKTALEYVRSRHAEGVEGSDFARSARQQKVIAAFKEKVLSAQTLLNPAKVLSLYSVLKSSIDTDIKQDEMDDFIRLAQKEKKAPITSVVIDTGDETRPGLLTNPTPAPQYNYAWVLTPRVGDGNYTEIQNYVSCVLTKPTCTISKIPQ